MTRDLMTWSGFIGRALTFCGSSRGGRRSQRLLLMLWVNRSRPRSPSARATAGTTTAKRYRRRGGARALVAVAALAGVAVLIAGCGGGSSLGVASISGSSTSRGPSPSSRSSGGGGVRFVGGTPSPAQRAGAQVAQLKFSRCMRAHGVPNFPDPPPASGGGFGLIFGGSGIDPAAPLFGKAQRLCISILTHQRVVAR